MNDTVSKSHDSIDSRNIYKYAKIVVVITSALAFGAACAFVLGCGFVRVMDFLDPVQPWDSMWRPTEAIVLVMPIRFTMGCVIAGILWGILLGP